MESQETVSEKVSLIVRSFSLTPSQASRVLGISRETFYVWLHSQECPGSDHTRLITVWSLAKQWEKYNVGVLGDNNLTAFDDGKSIVGLLSSDDLTDEVVTKVAERLNTMSKSERRCGTGWREAFAKLGYSAPTAEQQDGIQDDNLRSFWRDA